MNLVAHRDFPRIAEEQAARLMEALPRLQALGKRTPPRCHQGQGENSLHQSWRCGCRSSEGNYVLLQQNSSSLFAARVDVSSSGKALAPRIHSDPSFDSGEHLVCGRDQAVLDGRIRSTGERREGIHRYPHLQEESEILGGILDRRRGVLSRLTAVIVSFQAVSSLLRPPSYRQKRSADAKICILRRSHPKSVCWSRIYLKRNSSRPPRISGSTAAIGDTPRSRPRLYTVPPEKQRTRSPSCRSVISPNKEKAWIPYL